MIAKFLDTVLTAASFAVTATFVLSANFAQAAPFDFANAGAQQGEYGSPLEIIASWYEDGFAVTFGELKERVFEGRCFYRDNPHKGYNFVLLAPTKAMGDLNQGPGFPVQYENKIAIFKDYDAPKSLLLTAFKNQWEKFGNPLESDESEAVYRYIKIRKYDGYYMWSDLIDKVENVTVSCYFFGELE